MSFPVLTTDRLVLRAPEAADCEAFVAYAGSARTRFVGGAKDRFAACEKFAGMIGHWHLLGYGRFTIVDRATGAAIGHVGPLNFRGAEVPEITWTLWTADAEGRGLATEAALAARDWMRAGPGFARAETAIHVENTASQRIAARLGGRPTGLAAAFLAGAMVWTFDLAALPAAETPIKQGEPV